MGSSMREERGVAILLHITQLITVFEIHDNESEAIDSFR